MGNRGWSFDDVQPFFQKIRKLSKNCDKNRGTNGPLKNITSK